MNWVDLLILIILFIFVLESLKRSFIFETLDFLSFLLALISSFIFYGYFAHLLQDYFKIPHSLATVVGFISVWFLTETTLILITHLIFSKLRIPSWFKKLNFLSAIPAICKGLIFISILLILIASFPIQPRVKKSVDQSRIGSILLNNTQKLESPLKSIFGGITQDTLSFITIKPNTSERINLGFETSEFTPAENLEKEMINLINNERSNRSLDSLEYGGKLREVARFHSNDMFKRGYFSHYSPEGQTVADRAEKFGISFLIIGENLAYAPTLNLAHSGLMNSPGHRANILSADFNKIGIGIMDGGVYGLMITQVFSN